MSHVRFVAVDNREKFLIKPKGMHTWSNDLSKARLFISKDAVLSCILNENTKQSVKKRFKGIRKVECKLVKIKIT